MYVSRLSFHTLPGHTNEVIEALQQLERMVTGAGGRAPRILRTHYASLGAADVLFEQQAPDLGALEREIEQVTRSEEFQRWSNDMSSHLAQSPKREVYILVNATPAGPADDDETGVLRV